jgi:hypothetical protein
VVSISRGIEVASETARSQPVSVRSTSAAGIMRWTSRAKLRAMTVPTIAAMPNAASHQMCQTNPNAVTAPTMPITGPVIEFFGISMSS